MADLLIEMGLEKSDTALSSFCVAIRAAYPSGLALKLLPTGD